MRRPIPPPPPGDGSCGFCGFQIPSESFDGPAGTAFCSERCRQSHADRESPFAGRFGFKQYSLGVSALDALLPWGIPANSFVLLTGHEGIRHRGLQTELVWRALTRGEAGIIVTYVDPPVAIVDHFLTFGWNVLPFLESEQLQIIDCFTHRLREDHRSPSHQVEWNDFVDRFLQEPVTVISDPTNLRSVETNLHETLRQNDMIGSGIVVLDSLNEIEVQGVQHGTEQFIKEVRGDICNRNFVPIFASATQSTTEEFAQEHAYLFDGIIDMRRTESLIPGARIKQLSIRKMDGVRYRPQWVPYEHTGHGFEIYDPQHECELVSAPPQHDVIGRSQ